MLIRRALRNALMLLHGVSGTLRAPRYGKRVITFHEVKDPARFRSKIHWLREHYKIVSLADLLRRPLQQKTMVALTFDDGYRCWHEQAAPILAELHIPAVFFVCSGFVGLNTGRAVQFCRERLRRRQQLFPLTRQQLVDLASHPLFEIGSHTRHHVDLGQAWSEKTLEEEIEGDRRQLEHWTGTPVRWFAYPFGGLRNVSPQAKAYLTSTPLQAAFLYTPQFLDSERGDRLLIGRDGLDVMDSTWLWQAWLAGGYDALSTVKSHWHHCS